MWNTLVLGLVFFSLSLFNNNWPNEPFTIQQKLVETAKGRFLIIQMRCKCNINPTQPHQPHPDTIKTLNDLSTEHTIRPSYSLPTATTTLVATIWVFLFYVFVLNLVKKKHFNNLKNEINVLVCYFYCFFQLLSNKTSSHYFLFCYYLFYRLTWKLTITN